MPDDGPSLVAVLQRSLPVVVCDQPQLDGVADVGIDDHAAIRSLGAHPIGLGHRRIGVVCLGRNLHERVGLTTVCQPVLEKGRAAGKLLLDHPQPISRTVMLPTKLVVRNTSGRAAS